MPPSIHPETGKPYIWLREFDFAVLDLGIGPFVPASAIEKLAVAEHATYEFETREPLTFTDGQLERHLDAIPVSELHYDDWIKLGQALHHQFGGSDAGFDLWVLHTKRSSKFGIKQTPAQQLREMRRVKWKSFGRYRGKPVTMASVIEWAKDARIAELRASFDDEDDADYFADEAATVGNGDGSATARSTSHPAVPLAASPSEIDDIDAIGGDTPLPADSASDIFDDILGGDEAEPEDEVDDIDAIGGNRPVKGQSKAVVGDWISLLDINDEGAIKPSLHNVELIVTHDPRLSGLPQLNEFTQETVQRTPPGRRQNSRRNAAKQARQLEGRVWQVRDELNGELWSDDRDFAIRSILEAPGTQGGYGIKVTDRDLKAAIVLSANGSAFHPVREYLESTTWDGTPRVEMLFTDYVGAPNDAYMLGRIASPEPRGDTGSAARFFNAFPPDEPYPVFYHPKAGKADRAGSRHPTVKPIALMQWLCRLITPPGGTVLDPFAGSGTTGEAARREGFAAILMEGEPQFATDIRTRFSLACPTLQQFSDFDDLLGGYAAADEMEDILG